MADDVAPDDGDSEDDELGLDEEALKEVAAQLQRSITAPINELLRQQGEILRKAAQEPVARWAETQAAIARSLASPMIEALQANIASGIDNSQLEALKARLDGVAKAAAAELPKVDFSAWTRAVVEPLQLNLARLASQIDVEHLERTWRRALPPNWTDLDDSVKFFTELLPLAEAGLPVAWVPRADVIEGLLDAPEADRPSVFDARRQDVLEDCSTVLQDITSPELVELVALLEQALTVAAAGHDAAAQALAASVLDTTLRHTFRPQRIRDYYGTVKAEITDRHENATIAEMRWTFVHVPVLVVLNRFDASKGDPIPDFFNRHASAHAAGLTQYTPANAVIALALATSLAREAHQKLVDDAAAASGTTP